MPILHIGYERWDCNIIAVSSQQDSGEMAPFPRGDGRSINQINSVIEQIRKNPDSRLLMVNALSKSGMKLAACGNEPANRAGLFAAQRPDTGSSHMAACHGRNGSTQNRRDAVALGNTKNEVTRQVDLLGVCYTLSSVTTKKHGRNDPCPCGSGKKFKHCCLDEHPNSRRVSSWEDKVNEAGMLSLEPDTAKVDLAVSQLAELVKVPSLTQKEKNQGYSTYAGALQRAGYALCFSKWPPSPNLWGDFKRLVAMRNEFVHFKLAEYEQIIPPPKHSSKATNILPPSVQPRQVHHGWAFKVLNPDMAEWAVKIADSMLHEFRVGYAATRKLGGTPTKQ